MATSDLARVAPAHGDAEIERVRTFAHVFDRYGLDAVIGFVLPGIGDAIGALLGLYVVVIGIRRRVSSVVIARMLLNLGIDMVIGVVPLIGDVADVAFRANEKNLKLLEARPAGGKAHASDWAVLAAVGVGFTAVLVLLVYVVIAVVHRFS
ncbi:MAG TPA: DUF4112 domain-containing protein [Kofleriaceae bacterium]